ncbi:hypothetical protein ADUPG1_006359, partial [Aduncisulcus paluster]
MSCNYTPRKMCKERFLGEVGAFSKSLPKYIYDDELLLAVLSEFIGYLNSFALNSKTITLYALQLIMFKEYVDSEFSPKVFELSGLGFIASQSLIRSYSMKCAPSSAKNCTYALKFAGQLLEEKNKSYSLSRYTHLFKEIRRAATRKLRAQKVESELDPKELRTIFCKIKKQLSDACASSHVHDTHLLKFQRLLFVSIATFTTQRAASIRMMRCEDVKSIDGSLTLFMDLGRKKKDRVGKSRYPLSRKWRFLEEAILLWIKELRERFFKYYSSSDSENSLEDLPLFFTTSLNLVQQATVGKWMDIVCGKHVT